MMRVFFITILVLLAGCETIPDHTPARQDGYWLTQDWQRATLHTLVFDYKEDGVIDYEWPAEVPPAIQAQLTTQTKKVVDENWSGE